MFLRSLRIMQVSKEGLSGTVATEKVGVTLSIKVSETLMCDLGGVVPVLTTHLMQTKLCSRIYDAGRGS